MMSQWQPDNLDSRYCSLYWHYVFFTLILFTDSDTNKETGFKKSPESGSGLSTAQLAALVGGVCALLIIISVIILALRRKQKAKRRKQLAHNLTPRR